MPANVSQQMVVFIACILTGLISGIVFDILSIISQKLRFKKSAVFVQDIFIWVIILSFFFSVIYEINGAILRWYIFLGAFFGSVLYILILRNFSVKIIAAVMNFLAKTLVKIATTILLPVRKILKLFKPLKKYVQIIRKKKDNFVQKNIEKLRRIKILLNKI